MAEHIIYLLGPLQVPGLGQERHVRVYAPNEAAGGAPVLFMFDGQNIFHDAPSFSGGWYVHHAVRQLAEQGLPAPVIVGIDHGGSSRLDELSPFTSGDSAGRVDELLAWSALCMSPSFWFAERKIFDSVAAQPKPWTSRIYIDAGAKEGGGSVVAASRGRGVSSARVEMKSPGRQQATRGSFESGCGALRRRSARPPACATATGWGYRRPSAPGWAR